MVNMFRDTYFAFVYLFLELCKIFDRCFQLKKIDLLFHDWM